MNIDLTGTTTRKIQDALTQSRHLMGGPAVGMVLTLIIVTDESAQYDAVRAATEAAREHPCRVLTVISRDPRGGSSRLDAEIRMGETGPGETVLLRMYGPLAEHADSVVVPLLMPDTPVVTWWPGGKVPKVPAKDPLGALAQRRVTDAYAARDRLGTLAQLAHGYRPGDTDFTWTRLTSWRSLLAAALDQEHDDIVSGEVSAEPDSPSAELLAAWLSVRLGVPLHRTVSEGPGITGVRLTTTGGDIVIDRPDGRVATLCRPGQPDRQVSLLRRPMADLLAEELRRLDPDEVYREAASRFAKDLAHGTARPGVADEPVSATDAAATTGPAKRHAAERHEAERRAAEGREAEGHDAEGQA
ncbi:glucose-6-phosphate dehydrogenase assembly protein OpcA [Actinomadura meyerae]|jgi:glucose-6-phosphate dehydrogenase assembly protein OpcA|uniref:Glucose-6-phosphate dehydrogenase assembly protein OpcA n=1 Tax=Actinomadura meyerae TaxID=240840 RepID=A0A239GR26_9ACTN|nr:glucose-6-phosphate dehydrogenase assembly protein OpcA [Actinomadura meyerae]SNS71411.1 glucose-6-phosphate dehydrogenase assembly protein OpcA [Actinomadura meyerae]